MKKQKTPKFIEVTVVKSEQYPNSPLYNLPGFGRGELVTHTPAYRQTFNTSAIVDTFIDDSEDGDYFTVLDFNDGRFYIEEAYEEVKSVLGVVEI